MKRLLSAMMIFCLLLGLTACGDEEVPVPPVSEENKTETAPVPETESPETPEESPEVPMTAEPVLQLQRGDHYRMVQDEVTQDQLCEVRWQSLLLSPESAESYPELADALRLYSDESHAEHEEIAAELADLARETIPEVDVFLGYTATTEVFVHRADENILSIRIQADEYTGGAHPNYGTSAFNLDPITGKEIELGDVVKDLDRIKIIIADRIKWKYPYEEFAGLEEQLKGYYGRDFTWTLDHQGITFWFSPYEIAPYAAGAPNATITFAEWPQIFNEKYLSDADRWAVELPLHHELTADLQTDNEAVDTLRLVGYAEDNGFLDLYLVVNEEEEYPLSDVMAYSVQSHLVYAGEQFFLFVEGVADSDYRTLYVYRLTADGPQLTDTVIGGYVGHMGRGGGHEQVWLKDVLTDPAKVTLSSTVQLLGTWTGEKTYTFDPASGTLKADSEVYTIEAEREIHTSAEIEVTIDGKAEKLPAGTALTLLRTDGETYAELRLEDGRKCRIDITHKEGQALIGGIPEWECFDDLFYAG